MTLVAHTVVPAEFREVVSEATLIVRGRITDVRSVDTVPGQGVDSIATVLVENRLKGQASSFVYVRVPGGTIGSIRYTMVGAPTFKPGQRAVFFLKPGINDTTYRPVGLTMGLYRIRAEPRTESAGRGTAPGRREDDRRGRAGNSWRREAQAHARRGVRVAGQAVDGIQSPRRAARWPMSRVIRHAVICATIAAAIVVVSPEVQAYLKLGASVGNSVVGIDWVGRTISYRVTNRDVDRGHCQPVADRHR